VPKSTVDHAGSREVRLREQTPVRVEVVEPRRPDDPRRLLRRPFEVREELGEVREPLPSALDGQRRAVAVSLF
jgi:hypothetical protein